MPATLRHLAESLPSRRAFACASLLEQGSGSSNEDALLVRDRLYGVFDGASSLKGPLYRDKSGAWWAAHLARAVFSAADDSLAALAARANEIIARGMTLSGVDRADRLQLWSTSAAVVRLHAATVEFVQSGDALILCIHEDGSFSLPAPYRNHDRETLEQWRLLTGLGFENVRELLTPRIEQVRLQMNRSYGVLNGEAGMSDFLRTGTIAAEGLAHLLIFTDGLHLPLASGAGVDFAGMVDCYLRRGLSGLHQAVRGVERSDPDCRAFPRFKIHDDVAAVALDFTV
jgi:hypothetical protein